MLKSILRNTVARNQRMTQFLVSGMDRLSRQLGYQVRKSRLDNRAWDDWDRLYDFELSANDREWQQLAMYLEVFLRVKDLPGDFIEFGVGTGVSLMSLTRLNDIYQKHLVPLARRRIYGFDSFEGLPNLTNVDYASENFQTPGQMKAGGYNGSGAFEIIQNFRSAHPNLQLVKGWFKDTVPGFVEKSPHLAFSLVHVDCDLYESTRDCLNYAFERVVPGGVILFDEVFHPNFPGETVGFWEVFNRSSIASQFTAQRVAMMPWKTYFVRNLAGASVQPAHSQPMRVDAAK
jgi:hypothetical protein